MLPKHGSMLYLYNWDRLCRMQPAGSHVCQDIVLMYHTLHCSMHSMHAKKRLFCHRDKVTLACQHSNSQLFQTQVSGSVQVSGVRSWQY